VRIEQPFEGPPGHVNGGVIASVLAGEGPAEVTIRRPVPLDTELVLDGDELRDGAGEVLAFRRPTDADLAALAEQAPQVAYEDAVAAGTRSAMHGRHPFPGCFGCGPANARGLHCLAGPVDGRDGVCAVGWIPAEAGPRHVWAALDCPSSAPVVDEDGGPIVLGRIAGALLAPVDVGAEHVVVSWPLGTEGRRRHAASVVVGPDGVPRAAARATWVALTG
jgi:hypothetical protein